MTELADRRRPPPRSYAVAERVARHFYGDPVDVTWIPSDEAFTFRLEFTVERPRIVKVERPDRWVVRREQVAFPALRSLGFREFPEVEHTQADLRRRSTAFMVMPETPWRPLDQLWRDDPAAVERVATRVGDLLRRLASVRWTDVPGAVTPDGRVASASWYRDFVAVVADHPPVTRAQRGVLAAVFDEVTTAPQEFGGWQLGQVLTDGAASFTVIDWPHIGAHWSLADLAGAEMGLSREVPGATSLSAALLHGYGGDRGLSDREQRELTVWRNHWRFFMVAWALRRGDIEDANEHLATVE